MAQDDRDHSTKFLEIPDVSPVVGRPRQNSEFGQFRMPKNTNNIIDSAVQRLTPKL
jgi:hypothetical protein